MVPSARRDEQAAASRHRRDATSHASRPLAMAAWTLGVGWAVWGGVALDATTAGLIVGAVAALLGLASGLAVPLVGSLRTIGPVRLSLRFATVVRWWGRATGFAIAPLGFAAFDTREVAVILLAVGHALGVGAIVLGAVAGRAALGRFGIVSCAVTLAVATIFPDAMQDIPRAWVGLGAALGLWAVALIVAWRPQRLARAHHTRWWRRPGRSAARR